MVPGAGAVVVGVEEALDVPEVLVDGEQRVAWSLEERGVVGEALLEVVDVVLEFVEEGAARLGGPVLAGGVGAEGVEEVLEDAQGGGGGLAREEVVVREGVGEEGPLLEVAGLCVAGSHVVEEAQGVAGEGVVVCPEVLAGEGGGESGEEEQEGRGCVRQAWLCGCGRSSHAGAVCAVGWCWAGGWWGWVALVVPVVAVLGVLRGVGLCMVAGFPSSLSDCWEFPPVLSSLGWWLWWSRGSVLLGCVWLGIVVAAVCRGRVAVVGDQGCESDGSEASGPGVLGRGVGCSLAAAGPALGPVVCS